MSSGIAGLLFINTFLSASGNLTAVIEVDGKIYGSYKLSEINDAQYIDIRTKYGYNRVELRRDKVRIIEADCADKQDVLAGYIDRPYKVIVCLPHKLIIRLEGSDNIVDGVAT